MLKHTKTVENNNLYAFEYKKRAATCDCPQSNALNQAQYFE